MRSLLGEVLEDLGAFHDACGIQSWSILGYHIANILFIKTVSTEAEFECKISLLRSVLATGLKEKHEMKMILRRRVQEVHGPDNGAQKAEI